MRIAIWLAVAVLMAVVPALAGDGSHTYDVQVKKLALAGDGGWLGVVIAQKKTQEDDGPTQDSGLLVQHVFEGSPAEAAGFQEGDVLVSVEGETVSEAGDFVDKIRGRKVGDPLSFVVMRDGREVALRADLGERPDSLVMPNDSAFRWIGKDSAGATHTFELKDMENMKLDMDQLKMHLDELGEGFADAEVIVKKVLQCDDEDPCVAMLHMGGGPKLGVRVEPLSDQLAEYFRVDGGILVTEVLPGSPAERAGIEAGDVITSIGANEIREVSDIRAALREAELPATFRVEVQRRNRARSFDVDLDEVEPSGGRPSNMRIYTQPEETRRRF